MWGFCDFLLFVLFFFFAFLWHVWGLLGVRLSWVKGSNHFGAIGVPRSRFDILAKCHICLYAYVLFDFCFLFGFIKIWVVSLKLGLLRYFQTIYQGRQSRFYHLQKVAIGLHMLLSYLRSFLFILFSKGWWEEGWGLGFGKFCNGSPPFSKIREVGFKIYILGLYAHICLFIFGFSK